LNEAHRVAAAYYHETLKRAPEAADARTYLVGQRRFSTETLERFQVGYSLADWQGLTSRLLKARFSEQEILDAGLGARRQDGGVVDRFRGRVMFPISDLTGDPVAFGARQMGTGEGPKYLNSAESPIYKKAQLLYALDRAKAAVVKRARALIVEGYTDVIALHQAGIDDAVATCGTALGLEHLRTLQRFTQDVVLALDADDAGGTAAERTYDQLIGDAQQMGLTLKVVLMPKGDDPADSVVKLGADAFGTLVDQAVPILEFVLRREADRYTVGDPEVEARAMVAGLRIVAKTDKENVRNEYVRRFSDWIHVDANILHVELDKILRGGSFTGVSRNVVRRSSAQVRKEREALKLAIQHAPLVKALMEDTGPEYFSVPAHRAIWSALSTGIDPAVIADTFDDADVRRTYTELAVQPPEGEVTERLASEIFSRLKEFVLSRQIDELKNRLQRLNPLEQPEEHESMFEQLIELERLKRGLSETGEGA
jgi:DNA primase